MKQARLCTLAICVFVLSGCSAQPVNPGFSVSTEEAHAAVCEMRDHKTPLKRPLVLIGGFLDPGLSPLYLANFFSELTDHPKIIKVSIACCGSFDECRRKVIAAVDAQCPSLDPLWTSEIDVVGVSLGGLVGRYAAAPPHGSDKRRLNIARLFTIASPHTGAKIAEFVAITDFHRDVRPGSAFLKRVAEDDASARYQLYAYVHLNDEIVGDRHAAPDGRPLWLSNPWPVSAHLAATMDDRILADIARRLRNERPFSHLPAPPMP